jgi:hypothetical protein
VEQHGGNTLQQSTINNNNTNNNTMTTRNVAPARNAKRVRLSEDTDAATSTIRVEKVPVAPSVAARNHVTAAVAPHHDAIKRIVLELSKTFITLRTSYDQKVNMIEKLKKDDFIPRSAKVSFKLTAPASILEDDKFKTLATAMEEKTREYELTCKKAIRSVADMVLKENKQQIYDHLKKAFNQLGSLCLLQSDPFNKPPTKKLAWVLASELDEGYNLLAVTLVKKKTLQDEFLQELREESDAMDLASTNDDEDAELNPTLSDAEKYLFLKTKPLLKSLLMQTFVDPWNVYTTSTLDNETRKVLEKTAKEFLVTEATLTAADKLDSEPSLAPSRIRELISEEVTAKTAKIQKELQRLKQTEKRANTPAKNSKRGAESSKESAPSTNKKAKKEGKKNETDTAETEQPTVKGASAARKGKGSAKKGAKKNKASGNTSNNKNKANSNEKGKQS